MGKPLKQTHAKKRGRPSSLTEEDIDRALRYVVRYGNGPAAKYSKLSRSTIERIKRERGFTGQKVYRPVINDVVQIGIEATSQKHGLSVQLVEDILKASGSWTDNPKRDVAELLK